MNDIARTYARTTGALYLVTHVTSVGAVAAYSAGGGNECPSRLLARWLVRRFAPSLLHAGSGAVAVLVGAAVISMLIKRPQAAMG